MSEIIDKIFNFFIKKLRFLPVKGEEKSIVEFSAIPILHITV